MQLTVPLLITLSALTLIKWEGSVILDPGIRKVLHVCYGHSSNTGHIITITPMMLYLFALEALLGKILFL